MSAEIHFEAGSMAVYDGSRRLGSIVPRAGKLECFDVKGVYICSVAERDRKAGMRAVAEADRKRRAMLVTPTTPHHPTESERQSAREEASHA